MKESKKRMIALIGTSSATIAVLVGITFSWWSSYKYAEVSNIHIHVEKRNDLAISIDDDDYKHEIYDNYEGSTFTQLSGDGVNFYTYVSSLDDNNALYISSYRRINESEYSESLYYQEVNFKTNFPIKLYFDVTSYLSPVSTSTRKIYGIPKDYIAGAMRVGLSKKDSDGNFKPAFVWAPNSAYHYDAENITFNTSGTVESDYKILRSSSETNAISFSTEGSTFGVGNYNEVGYSLPVFMWGTPTANQLITELDAGVTTMAFSVWLEGTDRECCDLLSGGHIKLKINLSSELIEEE